MTQLYAQPYDLSATGFYFETVQDFDAKANANRNDYGQRVEEYEIQFIDGEAIDCELATAVGLNQANFAQFFEAVEAWDEDDKRKVIIAVGECGYAFGKQTTPDNFDVDIYQIGSLRDLAEQFVDEGLFGDIPKQLEFYIDYEAIARDLAVEYSETTIVGQRLIYRAA